MTKAGILPEEVRHDVDPIEYTKVHKEFARAFESLPKVAKKLFPDCS
jgi:hypothetical protein